MDEMGQHLSDPYRQTLISVITKEALGALLIQAPYLAFGPMPWLLDKIIKNLAGWALDKTILGINMTLIRIKTETNVQELNGLIDLVSKIPIEEKEQRDEIELKIIESSRNLIKLYSTKL